MVTSDAVYFYCYLYASNLLTDSDSECWHEGQVQHLVQQQSGPFGEDMPHDTLAKPTQPPAYLQSTVSPEQELWGSIVGVANLASICQLCALGNQLLSLTWLLGTDEKEATTNQVLSLTMAPDVPCSCMKL